MLSFWKRVSFWILMIRLWLLHGCYNFLDPFYILLVCFYMTCIFIVFRILAWRRDCQCRWWQRRWSRWRCSRWLWQRVCRRWCIHVYIFSYVYIFKKIIYSYIYISLSLNIYIYIWSLCRFTCTAPTANMRTGNQTHNNS